MIAFGAMVKSRATLGRVTLQKRKDLQDCNQWKSELAIIGSVTLQCQCAPEHCHAQIRIRGDQRPLCYHPTPPHRFECSQRKAIQTCTNCSWLASQWFEMWINNSRWMVFNGNGKKSDPDKWAKEQRSRNKEIFDQPCAVGLADPVLTIWIPAGFQVFNIGYQVFNFGYHVTISPHVKICYPNCVEVLKVEDWSFVSLQVDLQKRMQTCGGHLC